MERWMTPATPLQLRKYNLKFVPSFIESVAHVHIVVTIDRILHAVNVCFVIKREVAFAC